MSFENVLGASHPLANPGGKPLNDSIGVAWGDGVPEGPDAAGHEDLYIARQFNMGELFENVAQGVNGRGFAARSNSGLNRNPYLVHLSDAYEIELENEALLQSAAWGDVNNDGFLDMALGDFSWPTTVSTYNPSAGNGPLFRLADPNSHALSYPIIRESFYPTRPGSGVSNDPKLRMLLDQRGLGSRSPSWADFDLDGDLDLYIPMARSRYLTGLEPESVKDAFVEERRLASDHVSDYLFLNRGWNTDQFSAEASKEYGLADIEELWGNLEDGIPATADEVEETDQDAPMALNSYGRGIGSTWVDFDNDGDQDLYVSNINWAVAATNPPKTLTPWSVPSFNTFYMNRVYNSDAVGIEVALNSEDPEFQEHAVTDLRRDAALSPVRQSFGINTVEDGDNPAIVEELPFSTRGSIWGDFDNDGDYDVFVLNQGYGFGGEENLRSDYAMPQFRFYMNTLDRHSSFHGEAPEGSGLSRLVSYRGMPLLDGELDLDKLFVDVTAEVLGAYSIGLDPNAEAMSGNWADYDNDGFLDLFVSISGGKDLLFRNLPIEPQQVRFSDGLYTVRRGLAAVSSEANSIVAGDSDGNHASVSSFGSAWADYDLDGDLDLFTCNFGSIDDGSTTRPAYNALHENQSRQISDGVSTYGESFNGSMRLTLTGGMGSGGAGAESVPYSNRSAVGARVHAYVDLDRDGFITVPGEILVREVMAGSFSHNQDSLALEFGLGLAAEIERLEIYWPARYPNTAAPTEPTVVENVRIPSNGFLNLHVFERDRISYTVHPFSTTAAGVDPARSQEYENPYTADFGAVAVGQTAALDRYGQSVWFEVENTSSYACEEGDCSGQRLPFTVRLRPENQQVFKLKLTETGIPRAEVAIRFGADSQPGDRVRVYVEYTPNVEGGPSEDSADGAGLLVLSHHPCNPSECLSDAPCPVDLSPPWECLEHALVGFGVLDSDGDGLYDTVEREYADEDLDDDNDGLLDIVENPEGSRTPTQQRSQWTEAQRRQRTGDSDGNGVGDALEHAMNRVTRFNFAYQDPLSASDDGMEAYLESMPGYHIVSQEPQQRFWKWQPLGDSGSPELSIPEPEQSFQSDRPLTSTGLRNGTGSSITWKLIQPRSNKLAPLLPFSDHCVTSPYSTKAGYLVKVWATPPDVQLGQLLIDGLPAQTVTSSLEHAQEYHGWVEALCPADHSNGTAVLTIPPG